MNRTAGTVDQNSGCDPSCALAKEENHDASVAPTRGKSGVRDLHEPAGCLGPGPLPDPAELLPGRLQAAHRGLEERECAADLLRAGPVQLGTGDRRLQQIVSMDQ